jgi:hypothetical protein
VFLVGLGIVREDHVGAFCRHQALDPGIAIQDSGGIVGEGYAGTAVGSWRSRPQLSKLASAGVLIEVEPRGMRRCSLFLINAGRGFSFRVRKAERVP